MAQTPDRDEALERQSRERLTPQPRMRQLSLVPPIELAWTQDRILSLPQRFSIYVAYYACQHRGERSARRKVTGAGGTLPRLVAKANATMPVSKHRQKSPVRFVLAASASLLSLALAHSATGGNERPKFKSTPLFDPNASLIMVALQQTLRWTPARWKRAAYD